MDAARRRSAPGRLITNLAFNSAEPGLGIARGCIKLPDLQQFVQRGSASGRFIDDHPGILAYRHCIGEYQRMKGLGVKFHGEPDVRPYGTGVMLEDLYGNRIFMNQEPRG